MVQTEVPQLSRECIAWRERLHSYRDEFNHMKNLLQNAAAKALTKDQQKDLEHYQNQLHIQLINIHDLKQSVKAHERQMQFEVSGNNETDFATHEALYSEYQSLEHTLKNLRNDIHSFIISLQ